MKARREARRIAIDVLYQAEIRGCLPTEALEQYTRPSTSNEEDADRDDDQGPGGEGHSYARSLVEGVQEKAADIDVLLSRHADRWAIERMPVIDRTVLRIAVFEMLWGPDVPVPVAINEAVELVKVLSTEDSGRFVNGLLGKIAESQVESEEPQPS